MDNNKVLVTEKEGVFYLSLNNPAKMNCMGFTMLNQLNEAICDAERRDEIKVVVIRGNGEKAFSTGADLKEFKNLTPSEEKKWISLGNSVFNKIEQLGKPTVAFIDGYAIGGGLELALACDFRVGTEKTKLSSPELQHGWLPGWGGMTRMRRLFGESVAKEVILLSEMVDAEKALHHGMLNFVVESENSEEFRRLIQHLLSIDTSAFALAKSAIADEYRTTSGADVIFDILAMQLAQQINR